MAGSKYNVIVIGGGHNGLVNAAYLAKAGKKVLVLVLRPCTARSACMVSNACNAFCAQFFQVKLFALSGPHTFKSRRKS